MDDDTSAPTNDSGAARKRTPPTIELTAQDVSETARASDTPAAESPPPESETPESEAPESRTPDKTPSEQTPAPDAAAPHAADDAPPPPPRRGAAGLLLLSAVTGAVVSLTVLGAAMFAGWPARNAAAPLQNIASKSDVDALGARLAGMEAAAAKPAPEPAPRVVTDPAVVARLDALDKSVAALREQVAAARSQGDKAVAALGDIKAAAPPSAAPAVDTVAIDERLGQLERATSALSAAAAKPAPPPPPPPEDPRLRRAVAATLLESAVRQGEPFAAALAAARANVDDAGTLAPLDVFATTGVPSAAALSRELVALLPRLAPKETPAAPSSGLVERLQHSAARLVRVQRTDAPSAEGDGAVVARIAAAARRDDIAGARREMDQLAPAQRAVVQPWIAKADARAAALSAARQFAAETMTALARPAPAGSAPAGSAPAKSAR